MILLAFLCIAALATSASAQSLQQMWPLPTAADTLWDTRFATPGIDSYHHGEAVMVANDRYLYVAGSFPNIGPHRSRGLMRWDGTQWEDLSQGFTRHRRDDGGAYDIYFHALALDSSGNLYAFANVDSVDGKVVGRIVKFDGTQWHDYSKGLPREIFSPFVLETRGHDLLFTAEAINGYIGVNRGDAWRALPPVRDTIFERARILKERAAAAARRRSQDSRRSYDDAYPQVVPIEPDYRDDPELSPRIAMRLAVAGDDIYIYSNFHRSDSAVLLRLRDSVWEPIRMDGKLLHGKLHGHEGKLYAKSYRLHDGKAPAAEMFDGSKWTPLPESKGFGVTGFFHLNGSLMAIGSTGEGWGRAGEYARWTGAEWQHIPKSGIGGYEAKAFAGAGGRIYAHIGFLDTARWHRSNLIEHAFDPSDPNRLFVRELESTPTLGISGGVSGIVKYQEDVVVTGNIHQAGYTPVDKIAAWNDRTSEWQDLGAGLFANRRKSEYHFGTLASDSKYLYVAGYVVNYPGMGNHVFRYNGSSWDSLGKTGLSAGSGGRGYIRNLYADGKGGVYVGGQFDAVEGLPASGIAYHDGKRWRSLDGGVFQARDEARGSATVTAITEYIGQIYVAGSFNRAGRAKPIRAKGIARWDGKRWHGVGDSLVGHTAKMIVHKGELYLAGQFYHMKEYHPPVYSVARLRGDRWEYELLAEGEMREASDIFERNGELYVVRREEHRHGKGYYSWLYKRTSDGWQPVMERILNGPSTYLVDGDKLFANPSLFGGKHISQGFGIMRLPE